MLRRFLSIVLLAFGFLLAMPNDSEAQLLKTKLKITVLNELGNPVEDAKVTIFKNRVDYDKEKNPVEKFQMTDHKGAVVFKGLDSIPYYVMVVKGEMNNFGRGEKVNTLEKGRLNKVNVVISDGL